LTEKRCTQIKRSAPVQKKQKAKASVSRSASHALNQLDLSKRKKSGKRVSNDEEKQDDDTDVMVIAMRAILVRLFILVDILPERFLALSACSRRKRDRQAIYWSVKARYTLPQRLEPERRTELVRRGG
jgi:hypothetical protein